MRLVTYRPFYTAQPSRARPAYSSLGRLHEDMNRLFEQSLGQLEQVSSEIEEFTPSLDVDQDEDHYRISLEVPGVRREDVSVETRDDALVISGTKHRAARSDKSENVQSSRQYGRFVQALSLPEDADRDGISAEFTDGVLSVTVPRDKERDAKRSRQIEVKQVESSGSGDGEQQRTLGSHPDAQQNRQRDQGGSDSPQDDDGAASEEQQEKQDT